jgi:hypothetical protein
MSTDFLGSPHHHQVAGFFLGVSHDVQQFLMHASATVQHGISQFTHHAWYLPLHSTSFSVSGCTFVLSEVEELELSGGGQAPVTLAYCVYPCNVMTNN